MKNTNTTAELMPRHQSDLGFMNFNTAFLIHQMTVKIFFKHFKI